MACTSKEREWQQLLQLLFLLLLPVPLCLSRSQPKHFAPRYSIANWGICLPHACSAHVVHSIIETSLRPYNSTGIEFHIDVRDEHCTTKQRKSFAKQLSKDNNLAMGM